MAGASLRPPGETSHASQAGHQDPSCDSVWAHPGLGVDITLGRAPMCKLMAAFRPRTRRVHDAGIVSVHRCTDRSRTRTRCRSTGGPCRASGRATRYHAASRARTSVHGWSSMPRSPATSPGGPTSLLPRSEGWSRVPTRVRHRGANQQEAHCAQVGPGVSGNAFRRAAGLGRAHQGGWRHHPTRSTASSARASPTSS